jgi:transcriptional regulator with XRE-family HTH domain
VDHPHLSSGAIIRAHRAELGLTVEQAAERAELSPTTWRRAEHDRRTRADSLAQIAGILDLDLETLVLQQLELARRAEEFRGQLLALVQGLPQHELIREVARHPDGLLYRLHCWLVTLDGD